jgi:hypothetical protein
VSTADESAADLIERAGKISWDAMDGRSSGVPWHHAGPWRRRKYLQMVQALHTAGLLVDPALGRDLNRLQTSRDEWRGRAEHAEAAGKLDRKRANDAARKSAAAVDATETLQAENDRLRGELADAADEVEQLRNLIDEVTAWAEGDAQLDNCDAQAVLDIVRPPDCDGAT